MATQNKATSNAPLRLHTYKPVLDRLIYGLALLGLLVVVHLWIQQGRGFDRGCLGFSAPQPAATVDCQAVTSSVAGTFMGVSNALLGGLFYLGVAVLTALAAFRQTGAVSWIKGMRLALVGGGALYSAYLVYYQLAVLNQICVLCTISAGIVAVLLVLHVADAVTTTQRTTFQKQRRNMTRELSLYALAAVLVLVLAGADILYFNTLTPARSPEVAAAQPVADQRSGAMAAECAYDAEKEPYEDYTDLIQFSDPMKGSHDAPVTVIEYFDPNCPHCKTLQPVMEAVIEQNKDQAQFVYKSFPLWEYSVPQVLALEVAAQQNKFFEMLDKQFEMQRQGGLSLDQLKEIAKELRMDPEAMVQRMRNESLLRSVMREREKAASIGVNAMPTVLINGRFVASRSRSVECLNQMIDEAVETAGDS